jgi:hypothetical protein
MKLIQNEKYRTTGEQDNRGKEEEPVRISKQVKHNMLKSNRYIRVTTYKEKSFEKEDLQ